MSKSLIRPEEALADPDSEQETSGSSKRSHVLHDVTNFSPHKKVVACKRNKNDGDTSSKKLKIPACNSLGGADGLRGGNETGVSWGLRTENCSSTTHELQRKEIVGIPWRDSDDSRVSDPHDNGEYQTLEDTDEISSSSLVAQQFNVSNHSCHNSIGNKRRSSDVVEGCRHILTECNKPLLFEPNELPSTSRVTSTSVFFPDNITPGSAAVSLASKGYSASHESCDKKHKQILSTNVTSYVGFNDTNIVKNTADFGRVIMGPPNFGRDMSSSSKLMNSGTSASGLPEFGIENSDKAPNCSCYFCCKAAYIWSDLNYHDVKGRLLALRKSMAHAASLTRADCLSGLFGGSQNQSPLGNFIPEAANQPLEFHLMHQWRSLFIQTQKAFSSENIQLQSTLHKAKELKEKCKKDLEVIHNVESKDL